MVLLFTPFRTILFCILIGSAFHDVQAQNRFFTKSGHIHFFSKAPLEDIAADTKVAVSFLDAATGEIVFSVPMKSFTFKKALMQEHFNENFVESDKFPKALFKGKILDFSSLDLSKNSHKKVKVEGVLTIHGVERQVVADGTIEIKEKQLIGKSFFSVSPQDFNIEIPFLVREHIAKRIDITVNMLYLPYQGKGL